MNDKPHPPLCPGTKDRLGTALTKNGPIWILYAGSQLDQILFCRDQACAWQDRARRYARVRGDREWFTRPWLDARRMEMECLDNADAWREWERGE